MAENDSFKGWQDENSSVEILRERYPRPRDFGSGGLVSHYENGGATVMLEPSVDDEEEQEYAEQGLGSFFADMVWSDPPEGIPLPVSPSMQDEIRASGRTGSDNREAYYPEGPTFFEALASDYDYPTARLPDGSEGIDPVSGKTRHSRPRKDMPTPQELEDTRAHMLGSALTARGYGPETARTVGNLGEFFSNRAHARMDKRNNAVGIDIFKRAGIDATSSQITQMVDSSIFAQLNIILGRKPDEQGPPAEKPRWSENFRSPADGPDLYFPRDNSGYFIPDN
jgi:hypothetical protein